MKNIFVLEQISIQIFHTAYLYKPYTEYFRALYFKFMCKIHTSNILIINDELSRDRFYENRLQVTTKN